MKKITLYLLLAIGFQYCGAQTTAPADEHLYDHYVGAQANALISHLINSSANSIGTGNPYLVTYSMNSKKAGWGLRLGFGGSTLNNTTSSTTGSTTTNNTDMQFRVGFERVFKLNEQWSAGTGIDAVLNYNDDNLTNSSQYIYDTSSSSTKTKSYSLGGGVFGKLNYKITHRIYVGTECSIYYVTGRNNETNDSYRLNGSAPPTSTETKSNPVYSKENISLPIVLFLMVRF